MTSRKRQNIEGQTPLFVGGEGGEYQAPVVPWQHVESVPLPDAPAIQPENEGIYVDLKERAEHLDQALAAIGQRNSRLGLGIAARKRPYSTEIWGRYQDKTPTVVDGAERNADTFAEVIKREFWKATGYEALRGSGLTRDDLIDRDAARDWRDFVNRFDHPDNSQARTKFRQHLRRVIKTSSSSSMAA